MVSQIPLNSREIRGDIVLDTHKMFRQTREYWKTQFTEDLLREGRSPSDLSPEEAEELNKLIDQRALNSMGVFMNSGGRMFHRCFRPRHHSRHRRRSLRNQVHRAIAAPTTYGRIGAQSRAVATEHKSAKPRRQPSHDVLEGLLSRSIRSIDFLHA